MKRRAIAYCHFGDIRKNVTYMTSSLFKEFNHKSQYENSQNGLKTNRKKM